jgi:hypothetical protein
MKEDDSGHKKNKSKRRHRGDGPDDLEELGGRVRRKKY